MRIRRISGLALAATAAAVFAAGCGSHSESDEVRDELARLRREQQVIKRELASIRAQMRRRPGERAAEPPPPRAVAPPTPSPSLAIADLLDAYRTALEAEDLEFLRDQVYGGALPTEDSRYLTIWFDRTEDLDVELEPQDLAYTDGRARAVVLQTTNYRLSRTQERRSLRMELRMMFEFVDGEWVLRRVSARR